MLVELVRSVDVRRACCSSAVTAGTPSRSPRRSGSCATRATPSGPGRPRWGGDAHAGRVETSLLLALEPRARGRGARAGQHRAARGADAAPARRRACARSRRTASSATRAARGDEEGRALLAAATRTCARSSRTSDGCLGLSCRQPSLVAAERGAGVTRPRSMTSSRTRLARQRSRLPIAGRRARGRARHRRGARDRARDRAAALLRRVQRGRGRPRRPTTRGSPTRSARPPSCSGSGASGWWRSPPTSPTPRRSPGAVEIAERRWGGLDVVVAAAGRDRGRRATPGSSTPSRSRRCSRSTSAAS